MRKKDLLSNRKKVFTNNAFTLIEVLAIIIILGIIAVITVPVVFNVLDNSKKEAAKDSAYGYRNAINRYYLSKMMDDNTYQALDDEYDILVYKNDGMSVNGEEPSEGWVKVVNAEVSDFSFKFGDYVVTYYSNTDTTQVLKSNELALTPEMEVKEDAKRTALAIVSGQSGETGIEDITEGWVAFINGDLKAYSVKVTVGGESYIVTDNNVVYDNTTITSTNAVANKETEVASKESTEETIIAYKVDTYVKAALTANSSIEDEEAYTVNYMSGVSTNPPDSGWIHFKKVDSVVTVYDYSLTYGSLTANYSSLTEGNYVSTFGDLRSKPILLAGTIKTDGAKYLKTVQEVYYNPVSGSVCNRENDTDKYTSTNSNTSVTTGCMHWYLYSVKGDYANMLLDHNISDAGSANGAWVSKKDYETGQETVYDTDNETVLGYTAGTIASTIGISYPEGTVFTVYNYRNNTKGPLTALKYLKTTTTNWKTGTPKVPNSTSTNEHIIPISANENKYQIDYTGYHARLITHEELEYIGCTIYNNSCGKWMKKGTSGDDSKTYANIEGYWTSSPYADNGSAWFVTENAASQAHDLVSLRQGIRPVITVLASDVL